MMGEADEDLVAQCGRARSEVAVTVIKDKDVNIIHKLGDKENDRRKPTPSGRDANSGVSVMLEDLGIIEEDAEFESHELPPEFLSQFNTPSALLGDGSEQAAVGFQTPKKRNSMLLKAQKSASKFTTPTQAESHDTPVKNTKRKTPCKTGKQNTPRKSSHQKASGSLECTPTRLGRSTPRNTSCKAQYLKESNTPSSKSVDSPSRSQRVCRTPSKVTHLNTQKTPYRERVSTKAMLRKVNKLESESDESFSSEEDSSDDSSKDDTDSAPENGKVVSNRKTTLRTPLVAPVSYKSSGGDRGFESEAYFMTQCSKSVTSNNTLSRLRTPRLKQEALPDLLADVDSAHHDLITQISSDHLKLVHRWLFSLWQGYSVILYGLGSKRVLLKSLHEEFLSDSNVIVVNGFFPGVTIKEILETILTQIFGEKNFSADALENVDLIESIQSRRHAVPLYLLVHNLDGPALRGDRAQTVLSRLARAPNVHLVASIDHINAALMWDQSKLRRFNFVWWDVTSFQPYLAETSFESSLLLHKSSALTLSALSSVFKSLTQNAKKLFMLLAKIQLECEKSKNFSGIPFSEFYWKCREAYIASTDGALRAQLTEFLDHNLVKYRRGIDGVESVIIPIESGILNQFIENYEDE